MKPSRFILAFMLGGIAITSLAGMWRLAEALGVGFLWVVALVVLRDLFARDTIDPPTRDR